MTIGKAVRYYDNHRGGWHFAYLIKAGRKWVVVQHPVKGKKKVLRADVDTRDWDAA